MDNAIYTLGYTAFSRFEIVEVLNALSISCLVDVRSNPMSSFAPQYNKGTFDKYLNDHGILYRHYAEFGARQEKKEYYSSEGYLDFEKYAKSEPFIAGIRKIKTGMELGYIFVLMCAEKDPITCHRSILVARAFSERGFDVLHIHPDNELKFHLETQQELEKRLVALNGDDLDQVSFLDSDERRIELAYQAQNRVIGYRPEEE